MTLNLKMPDIRELKPRITVFGVGGAGGNAVNNMIEAGLVGVDFVVANTDAQALTLSKAERIIQMGVQVTEGLGAGSQPEVGRAAAEEVIDEIRDHLSGAHMAFITAGMGGGTGTGSAPVVARAAREAGILTVGVVTKPFHFEGQRRMKTAEAGIEELQKAVDTLIVIPNQNLFRVANERTTFADAFAMADQVLYSGVACITDLMVKEGLINLDFADVRAIMREMGKAMMGTGEASGEKRAVQAAEAAIANPLLDDVSMKGARGLLISITGGNDLTLYEVDEAATRIREEVDSEANIILGATFDESLEGIIRVSVVATGIDQVFEAGQVSPAEQRIAELTSRFKQPAAAAQARSPEPQPLPQFRAPTQPQAQEPVAQEPVYQAYEQQAIAAIEDVTIRPAAPKPALAEPQQQHHYEHVEDERHDQPYIPPQAERARAPRMPRIDELPLPAQAQIRASREQAADVAAPDRKRVSLLQRLANGLSGRHDDEPQRAPAAPAAEPRMAAPEQQQRRPQPAPQAPAYRPAQGGLDAHGRQPSPAHPRGLEDEQLEIPAFLRRQAN
ncbi:cell division protein FtsZ [Methylopila jiangsuensis]|uniref:Cell division protein FtsZ n=1 Tax=Methylopila jiangsuensis TaxID=586230 RepID=A0A9W6JGK1_9HYPH|nr:cell division protein FtsZ [Methylopila jiangsuensis]MDR6286263.1 cell division protein FtsZ [Methylopila jiangsuensis]GLK76026.1 cell division protein FtsZ [Methylopila jiangsuensis]